MEENTLHPIAVDETTLKACREYNDKIIATPDQEVPNTGGGNGEKYKELLGAQAKSGDVEEFTYTQWGGNAIELLLLNLLQEYEVANTEDKKKETDDATPKAKKVPALLDPMTVKMGTSFKPHKKTQNVVQLMYVKQLGNNML